MATKLEADVEAGQGRPVLCRWCGQRTPPSPACEECGSPLDRRLRLDLAPLSEDLLERQLHSRATPKEDGDGDPSEPIRADVALSQPVADPAPAIHLEEPEVAAEPVVLAGTTWGVGPVPTIKALARKEVATKWGIRVGGFFGLVVLLDFIVTHL